MTYVHRVTFGSQYAREAHPRVAWAHPDGWLEIEVVGHDDDPARAADIAREFTFDTLGLAWSFDYTPAQWERDAEHTRASWYPLGVLARVTLDEGRATWVVFREFRQTMAEVTSAATVGDGDDGVVDT